MKRCYRCMGKLGESPVCPHCGYDSRKGQEIPYALQPGTVLHGKYLIGNVLGQGGFGITYLGFDMILEVKVAIKEYYVSSKASRMGASSQKVYWTANPGDMNHFITEARRMAKLDEMPEIAHVRDIFYDNQTAYIIMEYVEGETLSRYLQRTGTTMSYEQAVKLMLPVIDALGRVHGEGLVHRDISPDNLMREPKGTLRILDMGAAGDLTRNNGQASQLVARRGFSPYEQYVEDGKIGPWTDVYAVCATIYYCCTGRLIPDVHERMDQYLRTRKSELTLDAAIPPAGAKVLQKGLALEVENRIGNMAALAEQLKKSLETKKPVIPEPKPKPTPKPKPKPDSELLAKLKRMLIGAAAILVIVICAAALSSMGDKKDVTISEPPAKTTEAARTVAETTEETAGETAEEPTWETTAETTAVLMIADSLDMNDVDLGHTELVKVLSGPDAREITWSSSNPQAAPVSENGTVTAAGYGTSEITAEYQGQTAVCTVTVNLRANVTCKYWENETGLTISGYEGELPAQMVLPREINGKPVIRIGDGAFKRCTNLTSVTIPGSIRVVGDYAFELCTNLTGVMILDGVTSIGYCAFGRCTSLTSVAFPDSIAEICSWAFTGCTSLTSVTIPDSVTDISDSFFDTPWYKSLTYEFSVFGDGILLKYCGNAENVTIPNGVKKIAHGAFSSCTSLTGVTIPNSVTEIGYQAFNGCTGLTDVSIPNSVTEIGISAFSGCTSLTGVTIPNSVTEISLFAFKDCISLTSVTIPKDCQLGIDAFPDTCKIAYY